MPSISSPSLGRSGHEPRRTRAQLRDEATRQAAALVELAIERGGTDTTFTAFEVALADAIFALARTVLVLFLVVAEERVSAGLTDEMVHDGRVFRRDRSLPRSLMSRFGIVRYWRTYMRSTAPGSARRHGFHPLDVSLGLLADRIAPSLLALAVRLAARMSFAEARDVLGWFVPSVPSVEVIQAATLGYGRYAPEWFESAPAPENDGQVLIAQLDSKGAPTATESELAARRGKRKKKRGGKSGSPRHRGRQKRERFTRKARRLPGDKSKNAKMATVLVMYTLHRTRAGYLHGPINKRVYGSFACKRHAVEFARREATKRGFPPGTRKQVQVLTDGDEALQLYTGELFPDAIHTVDIIHVVEKVWSAGHCLFKKRGEREEWVEAQKTALYENRTADIVAELRRRHDAVSRSGPGTATKRETLDGIATYIEKRIDRTNYGALMDRDLEVGTGAVEGAIRALMCRRMDYGSMRWIKERAEAVLQLRCIDTNGDWDAFVRFIHDKIRARGEQQGQRIRLQQRVPQPLPTMQEAA
ncbi:MAG: hypothetical protein M3Q52_06595 [Pseudomonadota bacterium]|nr:hypothetical protein [Pseudomonadota bacterium]